MKITKAETVYDVKLQDIIPPAEDVRQNINPDKIRELADSIKEVGQQTPIILKNPGPPWEISQGHRRYLAARLLGATTIKAIIRDITEQDNFILRATENLQREDLSPIEEASIYLHLQTKYNIPLKDIATKFARSETYIRNTLRLLDAPDFARQALNQRTIAPATVLTLMQIKDEDIRYQYLKWACDNGATLAVAKGWLESYKRTRDPDAHGQQEPHVIRHTQSRTIYHECAACKTPTDINTMVSIFMCKDCADYLLNDKPHPRLHLIEGQ